MADSAEENINVMTSTWDGRGLIKMLNLLFKIIAAINPAVPPPTTHIDFGFIASFPLFLLKLMR